MIAPLRRRRRRRRRRMNRVVYLWRGA